LYTKLLGFLFHSCFHTQCQRNSVRRTKRNVYGGIFHELFDVHCPKIEADFREYRGGIPLEGEFPGNLGKKASFPRIIGKFSLQRTSPPILSEICFVFGTVWQLRMSCSSKLCLDEVADTRTRQVNSEEELQATWLLTRTSCQRDESLGGEACFAQREELKDGRALLYHLFLAVNCPVGTFYNVVSQECVTCPTGSYQDQEAQVARQYYFTSAPGSVAKELFFQKT
jgi:hypothetical protein